MPSTDELTHALHETLRQLVSQRKYELWFSSLRVRSQESDEVVLSVKNPFLLDWIKTYYMAIVRQAMEKVHGSTGPIELVVANGTESDHETPAPPAAPPEPPPVTPDVTATNHDYFSTNSDVTLNRRYTFDNFIVGPSNRLAHAAAYAVADAPAGSYNPLFLHGSVGLGKTHLLQAICHKAMQSGRALKVLYLSSETFVNQFISAVEKGDLDRFRYKYRNVDILLIDDIHLLANKERTQEEFFHTFNALYNAQRQIVLSSDSPPAEIPTLQERLISRFKWGLVAEIASPGYETRLAILRLRARERGVELPEEVLTYLAEHIDRNIRELEGAVTKVVGYAQLIHREIDLDLARQALGQSGPDPSRAVTGIDRILEIVCQHFDVRMTDLQGRKRTQSVTLPRQVAMYLARTLTPLSLEEIGGHFGGRDHSTVLYAVTKIRDRHKGEPQFAQLLEELAARSRR